MGEIKNVNDPPFGTNRNTHCHTSECRRRRRMICEGSKYDPKRNLSPGLMTIDKAATTSVCHRKLTSNLILPHSLSILTLSPKNRFRKRQILFVLQFIS